MSEPPELPPIANAALSLVLPLFNAEASVKDVVATWEAALRQRECDYEIILVDDGSTDATADLASDLAKQHARVRVHNHPRPRGIGATLATGIAAARHPLLCYVSGDPAYAPADLKKLLDRIDRVDLVSGCRTHRSVPGGLRWLGRIYRLVVRIVFGVALEPLPGWLGWQSRFYHWVLFACTGVRLHDVNCPFKLFRRSVFQRIPIQSEGAFVHAEVLAKANFLGTLMDEVGITGPPDACEEPLVPLLKEMRRVLSHAEFGPPEKPAKRKATAKK
ncbi:MAG: glycosyltransferase family 2 protein [Gemmataceae bacterium]|nr:glycosyltransferase family 2 protein [Gemmataceae bacterium]